MTTKQCEQQNSSHRAPRVVARTPSNHYPKRTSAVTQTKILKRARASVQFGLSQLQHVGEMSSLVRGFRRAGLRLHASGVARLAGEGVEAAAVQRFALPLLQQCTFSTSHRQGPRGSRAFHTTPALRSGEQMTEGAFTRLVDDCLEDLYGNLEVCSAPGATQARYAAFGVHCVSSGGLLMARGTARTSGLKPPGHTLSSSTGLCRGPGDP